MPYGVEKLTEEELKQAIKMCKRKIKQLGNLLKKLYDLAPCLLESPTDDVKFLVNKLERLKDKLSACEKELLKRKKGGSGKSNLGSPRFVDVTKATGTLTGTVTFTKDSTIVTGVGTLFLTELAVGNYIKPSTSGYDEWYRIESIESDTSLTLSWAFAQPTVTDPANSTLYNAEDGTSPATAFCHIRQATVDEVRVAGDIIYLRRGQTHLYAGVHIEFDEDGAPNNPIVLRGDDGTGWADETGLAKPKLTFGDTPYELRLLGDDFWTIQDLEVAESSGLPRASYSSGINFLDCDFHDNPTYDGLYLYASTAIFLQNCTFYENERFNLFVHYSNNVKAKDSTFNGGTVEVTDYGLYTEVAFVELENCTFGVTTNHSIADIRAYKARIIGRNIQLASPTPVLIADPRDLIKIEDYNGTKLDNRGFLYSGNIIRDTTVIRPEGAPSSARMEPNENCGLKQPLKLCEFTEELSRWLVAGTRSVKMYLRGSGWTVLPTADELYIEVYYYDGVTAKRAVKKSTATLPANDVWTEFPIDFVLNSDSPCYVNVILKKYEAGAKVYVDILPVWG